MFSFHKPKIYRSNSGCCICKAKSSSSRFTDSNKYENEFERCFRIQEKRSGEICNACVLLVKRWKKLSAENRLIKHWHHVVDARAGPGTKLTSGRRLTASGSAAHHRHSKHAQLSAGSGTDSLHSSGSSCTNQPLPLSANQTTNRPAQTSSQGQQTLKCSSPTSGGSTTAAAAGVAAAAATTSGQHSSTTTRRRAGSFSKARAIDTNVSTFTFGETNNRRNYMTAEGFSLSACANSNSLTKPQSALNSSAFESVIKRFRQRQQQQQLEAQRRQLNKQQRQRASSSSQPANKRSAGASQATGGIKRQFPTQEPFNPTLADKSQELAKSDQKNETPQQQPVACKRLKRSSESIGSISVDGLRVSSLLDSSLWRKEKICCGIIFRGLYNEVAIFPKLLKPCQCRMQKNKPFNNTIASATSADNNNGEDKLLTRQMLKANSPSPPPRAQKSGSISSCDSNTSGTGSMEEPMLDEELLAKQSATSNHYQGESLKFIYI